MYHQGRWAAFPYFLGLGINCVSCDFTGARWLSHAAIK